MNIIIPVSYSEVRKFIEDGWLKHRMLIQQFIHHKIDESNLLHKTILIYIICVTGTRGIGIYLTYGCQPGSNYDSNKAVNRFPIADLLWGVILNTACKAPVMTPGKS